MPGKAATIAGSGLKSLSRSPFRRCSASGGAAPVTLPQGRPMGCRAPGRAKRAILAGAVWNAGCSWCAPAIAARFLRAVMASGSRRVLAGSLEPGAAACTDPHALQGAGPRNVVAEVRREVPGRRGRPGHVEPNRESSLVEDFERRFAVVVHDGLVYEDWCTAGPCPSTCRRRHGCHRAEPRDRRRSPTRTAQVRIQPSRLSSPGAPRGG